jgi:hypothetical protein
MKRFVLLLFVLPVLLVGACREKAQTSAPAQATTGASPQQGVAPPANVTASPQPSGSVNPKQAVAVPGQMPNSLDAIPEQMRRPLTLDEIKRLPPESRDMILRAIGQPVPSPSPSPKKK